MKKKSTYEKLKEKYTDEEIADAFIFPSELTPEEQEKSLKEFQEYIKNIREKKDERARLITIECFRVIGECFEDSINESNSLEYAFEKEFDTSFRRIKEILLKYIQ